MKNLAKHAKRLAFLRKQIDEQKNWIADHGGNLAGYVMRYGSASDPKHYGDGGEAIYMADTAALVVLWQRLIDEVLKG